MAEILIYGKPTCPHTRRALDAHPDAKFIDVLMNPSDMEEMLKLSEGRRRIPVVVKNGQVTVGYNGGS